MPVGQRAAARRGMPHSGDGGTNGRSCRRSGQVPRPTGAMHWRAAEREQPTGRVTNPAGQAGHASLASAELGGTLETDRKAHDRRVGEGGVWRATAAGLPSSRTLPAPMDQGSDGGAGRPRLKADDEEAGTPAVRSGRLPQCGAARVRGQDAGVGRCGNPVTAIQRRALVLSTVAPASRLTGRCRQAVSILALPRILRFPGAPRSMPKAERRPGLKSEASQGGTSEASPACAVCPRRWPCCDDAADGCRVGRLDDSHLTGGSCSQRGAPKAEL